MGRDEKGCLPSPMKKAVIDVDHPAFFMVDVDHPAFFNLVDVDHCLFHGQPLEKGRLKKAGRHRPLEKGRLKKAGRRRPVEKGRLKKAGRRWPVEKGRGGRRPVEKGILWKLKLSFDHFIGIFHDQLYCKKYCLGHLEVMKFFLFFRFLSFCGTFGIHTGFRFYCQKYLKNSKFWKIKKISLLQNLKIHFFYFVNFDTTDLFSVDVNHPAFFYLVDVHFSALFITPFVKPSLSLRL